MPRRGALVEPAAPTAGTDAETRHSRRDRGRRPLVRRESLVSRGGVGRAHGPRGSPAEAGGDARRDRQQHVAEAAPEGATAGATVAPKRESRLLDVLHELPFVGLGRLHTHAVPLSSGAGRVTRPHLGYEQRSPNSTASAATVDFSSAAMSNR